MKTGFQTARPIQYREYEKHHPFNPRRLVADGAGHVVGASR
jgi:hypothetical protein